MDYQVLDIAPVYAVVAQRYAQDYIVDYASVIRDMGTCINHTDSGPV